MISRLYIGCHYIFNINIFQIIIFYFFKINFIKINLLLNLTYFN